jgi:hypothetical protein
MGFFTPNGERFTNSGKFYMKVDQASASDWLSHSTDFLLSKNPLTQTEKK